MRASVKRRSRETRETRAAAQEEKRDLFFRASPVSRLQSRAWSFACLGRCARRTKHKERLLVVQIKANLIDLIYTEKSKGGLMFFLGIQN